MELEEFLENIVELLEKYKNLQISKNDKTGKIYVKKLENIEIKNK